MFIQPNPHSLKPWDVWLNICRPTVTSTCGEGVAGCQTWPMGKASLGLADSLTYTEAGMNFRPNFRLFYVTYQSYPEDTVLDSLHTFSVEKIADRWWLHSFVIIQLEEDIQYLLMNHLNTHTTFTGNQNTHVPENSLGALDSSVWLCMFISFGWLIHWTGFSFGVVFVAYIIFGIAFNVCKKRTGWYVLPHIKFWFGLPKLVRVS